MRRALLPLALLAAVVVALGLAWLTLTDGAEPGGSGVSTAPLDVAPFRTLRVSGYAEVVLEQADQESVQVEAGSRHGARVRVRVDDGTLSIAAGEDAPWWSFLLGGSGGRAPRITVRYRDIGTIELSGAVRLECEAMKAPSVVVHAAGAAAVKIGALDATSFRFGGSGAVKADVAGRVGEQTISISGAGTYRAPRLVSDRADVKVSGAAKVVVNAARTLDATISGAGTIDYLGNPDVRQQISGAGRIRQISQAPRTVVLRTAALEAPALPAT